jgi:hypothetical protein
VGIQAVGNPVAVSTVVVRVDRAVEARSGIGS